MFRDTQLYKTHNVILSSAAIHKVINFMNHYTTTNCNNDKHFNYLKYVTSIIKIGMFYYKI